MKDPFSTLSNAAYLALAAYIAAVDPANQLLAWSIWGLGLASGYHHWKGAVTNTLGHKLDEIFIYMVMTVLIFLVYAPLLPAHLAALGTVLLLAMSSVLFVLIVKVEQADLFRWTPALSVVVIAGLILRYSFEAALPVLLTAGIGGALRLYGDNTDLKHGLWHLLSAASLALAWGVIS